MSGLGGFDRIPPDHPLTEAARNVNTVSEERGLRATIDWLGMGVSESQLAYLAEQRGLRAFAAVHFNYNMGGDPVRDEQIARRVIGSNEWIDQRALLIGAYMDGMAIGWKGRELRDLGPA